MKKITIIQTTVIYTSLILSNSVFAEEASFLNQLNSAAQTVQQTTAAVNQTSETVSQGGLVNALVKQLGISSEQAAGGSGALFKVAKTRMTEEAFNQLSTSVPNMDGMLAAVPKTQPTSTAGLLSSLASTSGNATLASAASLYDTFKQLDLSKDMIGQFTPVVVDYVQKNSGEVTANLLKTALSGS